MRPVAAFTAASLLLTTLLAGCRISSHKNGDNDNVGIATPFGSMQVKTNDNVDAVGLGITPYPGAQMVKKDKDNGAADVNMSFGSFHLGVKAVSYTTIDDPGKVIAFYKNDLKKFGDVLQCYNHKPVGQPTRTAEGLTCDSEEHGGGHISLSNSDTKTELRTGSKQRQHLVEVEQHGEGTKLGLVALELPSNFSSGNFNLKTQKDSD